MILKPGAVNLRHAIYWNFFEDVCHMALHYTGKLAMSGMPYLLFFTVRWTTASSCSSIV